MSSPPRFVTIDRSLTNIARRINAKRALTPVTDEDLIPLVPFLGRTCQREVLVASLFLELKGDLGQVGGLTADSLADAMEAVNLFEVLE